MIMCALGHTYQNLGGAAASGSFFSHQELQLIEPSAPSTASMLNHHTVAIACEMQFLCVASDSTLCFAHHMRKKKSILLLLQKQATSSKQIKNSVYCGIWLQIAALCCNCTKSLRNDLPNMNNRRVGLHHHLAMLGNLHLSMQNTQVHH